MSNTNYLKTELDKEILKQDSLNCINYEEIQLKDGENIHVYNGTGNYTAKNIGDITFSFNNENAWVWNKTIEISFKIGSKDGEIKNIHLDNTQKDYRLTHNENVILTEKGKNVFLIDNIKYKSFLTISLNNGDTISWKFDVKNRNSIDFNVYFKIDYLRILRKILSKNIDDKMVRMLKNDLSKRTEIIENLEKKLEESKESSNILEMTLNKEKIKVINMGKVCKLKDDNIKNISNKLKEHAMKFNKLNETINKKNNKIISLENNLDRNRQKFNAGEIVIKSKNKTIDSLNKKLVSLQVDFDNKSKKVDELLDDIKKKESIIRGKDVVIIGKDEIIENMKSSILDKEELNEELNKRINDDKKKMNELNKSIQEYQNMLSDELEKGLDYTIEISKLREDIERKDQSIANIKKTIKQIREEFEYMRNKYAQITEDFNKYKEENIKNKYNIKNFENELNNVVLKRRVMILENNLNDVLKNKKVDKQLLAELTEENKKLTKINFINKYNEKKLKASLDKAKIKINKEINSNKIFEEKIKHIKDSFILEKRNNKHNFNIYYKKKWN